MNINDIFAPIVADMREKSAEGEVRKLRGALEAAFFAMGRAGANADMQHPLRGAWEEARRVLEETA